MNNLMKLLIVVIALTLATESFAQSFGVKAGLNLSNMLAKDDDDTYSDDFKMHPGFHLGATAGFPITDMFSFETGLLLSTKGFNEDFQEDGYEYKDKVNLVYLDIPLTAKASFEVGSIAVFGVFGPYIGIGLSGKDKWELTIDGETESGEDKVKWGSDKENDDLKRFDFGLVMGAGVEINAIQIGLNYNLGLANISSYDEGGYTNKNKVLGISVGYKFGGE